MNSLKYFFVYLLPVSVYFAFNTTGLLTFMPIVIFFGIVPLLELFVKPDSANMDKKIAHDEKNKVLYDWILYLSVPVQIAFLIYFLFIIQNTAFGSIEFVGRILSMGLMCGVLGINVGHELGHRHSRIEQFLGEILLLTSLDTHFLPYHNGGHHRNVATPNDSATAKKNELLFTFWITSHFGSYIEAWNLENRRMRKLNKSVLSLKNRMVGYSIANIILLVTIYFIFGLNVLIGFIAAAVIGILLLETVNYIEHYGLLRKKSESGVYELVKHQHSWNSDHPIGRALLFNLSRHSDHHYNGSKKYQILDSVESSPQMPTGYPGMMVLAVFQPLWFMVMNKQLNKYQPEEVNS
ncbi:MAG: alkane 1-monooxygenase [Fulvivirga sp.]|uniref:alkane 1-monooxygenase n=1 Tax=Fulvivirga sp. TaxID=1931237 RepID=UPI0032EDA08C